MGYWSSMLANTSRKFEKVRLTRLQGKEGNRRVELTGNYQLPDILLGTAQTAEPAFLYGGGKDFCPVSVIKVLSCSER